MFKGQRKLIIVSITIVLFIVIYFIFKHMTMPLGEKEHLDLKIMSIVELNVDKWYSEQKAKIIDNQAIKDLQDYIKSLELIELEKDYERNPPGHLYMIFLANYSISIKGEYLSMHPTDKDDKMFTEYYIVDSGFNPITGSSKLSRFLDRLIDEYGE